MLWRRIGWLSIFAVQMWVYSIVLNVALDSIPAIRLPDILDRLKNLKGFIDQYGLGDLVLDLKEQTEE